MNDRPYQALADYGLIGDCHGAALVCRDGSIDWACLPRFDSPAVFARLLDRRRGGFWQIAPTSDRTLSSMRYVERTAVLETVHRLAEGRVRVRDALLPPGDGSSPSALVRLCEGLSGKVELASVLEARFDYGLKGARLQSAEEGSRLVGGDVELLLRSTIGQEAQKTSFTLEAGERAAFLLSWGEHAALIAEVESLLGATESWWRDWCAGCVYSGPYEEQVMRSAITLKLLSYRPSGAIVAAPTTSLPEEIGGERNWDYRYTWLRDASLILYALLGTGQRNEGHPFLDWICARVCEDPRSKANGLRIMYDVAGGSDLEERVLDHLEGYRGSRPVRVGNAAASQVQLDVHGEVLDCFLMCCGWGRKDIVRLWPHFAVLADWVCDHWRERDSGIWEVRGGVRHFVYSKVMAWVALDRALRTAELMQLPGEVGRWRREARAIRAAVLEQGWSERLGAFKQSFEDERLDASNLLIPLVGFLEPDDPRALSNLERTRQELGHNGLVYRYLDAPEGVSGSEGTFAICSFWLVNALAQAGRYEQAVELFERLLGHLSPLGLLSEEIDGQSGELLGNFPQGFSHAGLISSAVNLARAAGVGAAPEAEGAPDEATHAVSPDRSSESSAR